MPGSEFVIRELAVPGGNPPPTSVGTGKGDYETFRWTAKNHNIPVQPWSFGVEQRTVRTDYPGADDPTEQILGPNFTEFTLEGTWDDRYNMTRPSRDASVDQGNDGKGVSIDVGGYAVREWRRFEAMVRRGNPIRISFEKITIEGIVINAQFDYRHRARIGYSFTVSPHHRQPGGFFKARRSPRSALNARQLLQELTTEVNALSELQTYAPVAQLVGTIYTDAEDYVADLETALGEILVAIEQRNLNPELEPNAALRRLSSQFYSTTTVAFNLIELLNGYDSSEALAYESGAGVLLFETWARGLMYNARRVVLVGRRAATDILQRAAPNAIALYTPQQGESLYAISNRFYRTPHQWRKIAERNGLTSFRLSGAEVLVIPEVTTR